jgi:hypothetical protein
MQLIGLCTAGVLVLSSCADDEAPSIVEPPALTDALPKDVSDSAPVGQRHPQAPRGGYVSPPTSGAGKGLHEGRITSPSNAPARRGSTQARGEFNPGQPATHPTRAADVPLPEAMASAVNDPRYAGFRTMCTRFNQLRIELQPIELALSGGAATDEQVAEFYRLERELAVERKTLNAFKWQDQWTPDDRRVMGMLMALPPQ